MNTIGENIRNLRKKNDLTQEKLADFLGVTYQSVSKWECGVTCPDLSLIAPLTKLLRCTADELLGLTAPDVRREELEAAVKQAWIDGGGERDGFCKVYDASAALVREFPGEIQYLCDFAWNEANRAWSFDDDSLRRDEMEKAVRHFAAVLENTEDEALRISAVSGISQYLGFLGRLDEARSYVDLLPDTCSAKEQLTENCLRGDDLLKYRRSRLESTLHALLAGMVQCHPDPLTAIDDAEKILSVFIPDGNLLGFHCNMTELCQRKAAILMRENRCAEAVQALKNAKFHAKQADIMDNHTEILRHTSPYFDQLTENPVTPEPSGNPTYQEAFAMFLDDMAFDSIRGREDFSALLAD
ncbi:MAG: helix-turn-helix transcriptional regulator [Clostridia bacterium]|nr:helix-turn-helix transcriptional regulator [Clostridia bacterium]MBQ8513395.1 helix-turn-helix transcriptional regulator [Clostridia bacterium]